MAAAAATAARGRSRSPPLERTSSVPGEVRRLGRVRWYNGRRQIGIIESDSGQEVFVPVGGALNRNLVPATPGGLIHGTRVSYTPLTLKDPDSSPLRDACVDVMPIDLTQPGLECGVETRIGGRASNEDRLVANDLYDLGFLAGICDGHGGVNCVDYVSQRLPTALHGCFAGRVQQLRNGIASLTTAQEEEAITAAIREAFALTDREFTQTARASGLRDGSTALLALLAHGFEALPTQSSVPGCKGGVAKLFVANCGDCRAVLVRGRKARRLSEDHKPERRDETARIQKAGGIVIQDMNTGIHRVARKKGEQRLFLSTSRAFGDLELKEPRPLVIAEPEIVVHTLEPEDWAVVLACDGVWGVLSDQDVADAVWQIMAFHKGGPVEAAQEVANRAEGAGSTDNVTVLVMRLGWAQPPARMM
mmetsp:Transcript_46735/g.130105  ORF Transcript_46735/g.130105 Transcript_46735/m.130105 type:complete len:420 (-) Transcript_46735:57-1316(-)